MEPCQNTVILPESYNPQVEEKKIIAFWQKEQTFRSILQARRLENNGKYEFHCPPVSPIGFPHSAQILNSIVKDVFTRYAHMRNFLVESRFGWDCHGLPVEHEVDKILGVKTPADIQKMGIPAYNEECREFVKEYTKKWPRILEKMGVWVDFSSEYHTMDTVYMEKVWGVFKQLYDKRLVYRSTRVQPYSTGCFTQLSNFELKHNCKEVTETATIVSVSIVNSKEKLLVWTTNPWALVSNSAVCVKPKAIYVKVKVKATKVIYIVSKKCLGLVWKSSDDYEVLEEVLGKSLQNLEYEPLFKDYPLSDPLRVIPDESISIDIGTGIEPLDAPIVESLKERGHIFKIEEVKYDKPFCWVSDTPLINKEIPSWFIRVKGIATQLRENAAKIKWSPPDGTKEFIKWLKEHLSDWSISRTRYWGTPIPIWSSPSGDEIICVGSIDELKSHMSKMNISFENHHREVVDWVKIPSKIPGNPPLRRVPDVFDCFFESAIVPFLQETESLQVDLAFGGVDQTYGWFYTTLVLATALSRPVPFRNIFTTGLTLEHDENTVSKLKHNHNYALRLMEKYGSDAYRLYLISAPMAASQNSATQEDGVVYITEQVINPLYRIFSKCMKHLRSAEQTIYGPRSDWETKTDDITSWLFSYTDSIADFFHSEMKAYRMHTFLPRLIKLFQAIENVFIPITYPKTDVPADYKYAAVLFTVIHRISLLLAPFAPIFTEYIFQIQKKFMFCSSREEPSIHIFMMPVRSEISAKPSWELSFARMEVVVELVKRIRIDYGIPIQYKISELTLVHHRYDYLQNLELAKPDIMKLLNIQNFRLSTDHYEFGASLHGELSEESQFKNNKRVKAGVEAFNPEDVETMLRNDKIPIGRWQVPIHDIRVFYKDVKTCGTNYALATKGETLIAVKMNRDLEFYEEGTIKEILSRIQRLKKNRKFYITEWVLIYYSTSDECFKQLMRKHGERINREGNCELMAIEDALGVRAKEMKEEDVDIKGLPVKFYLNVKVNSRGFN